MTQSIPINPILALIKQSESTSQARLTLPAKSLPKTSLSFQASCNMSFVPKATEDDIPSEFICPITNEIMKHPLMSIHGHNYERDAIIEWLEKHSTCPLSRRELSISKLVTNCALKEKILAWCEAYDMMHLLESDQGDDDDNNYSTDPRHRIMGLNLTEKQTREIRQQQAKRRRHIRRALDRLTRRRGHVAARVVLNPAA